MTYRDYNPAIDTHAVRRIWAECGWLRNQEQDGVYVDNLFEHADDALVATIDGEPECAVIGVNGDMRYQDESIKLGAVAGVTTSRVSRKLGFAGALTARLLARQAVAGMEVSALGMFEQGFYDRLGFGTGAYEQAIRFDPTTLTVTHQFRPPKRLQVDDFEAVHVALSHRKRTHGGVVLHSPAHTQCDLGLTPDAFGLGYYDGKDSAGSADQTLSHFIWGSAPGEHGPYTIKVIAWQNAEQLIELLALIKSLGDQVGQISMIEIGEIQLQDLLKQPLRHRRVTRNSQFVNESQSLAHWQLRILNIEACLSRTHLNTPTVTFNLNLMDPVEQYLDDSANWRGIAGQYVVQLGPESSAAPGHDDNLSTLNASVNAFSRMWMGIRPASSLAITDNLVADEALLRRLDATLRLPQAHTGLEF